MKNWVSILGLMALAIQLQAQCLSGDCFGGYGKKKFKSGAIYTGQFADGQINGSGKLLYSNGSIYVGQWKNNLREGKGKMNFNSGDLYTGDYRKGKMDGYGNMVFSNGDHYEGQFKEDSKHGQGIYAYNSGDIYQGYFQYDQRNGLGTMTYKNGAVYKGNWSNDMKNGEGIYTDENGYVYEGQWTNGEFEMEEVVEEVPMNEMATYEEIAVEDERGLIDCNSQRCHNVKGIYIYRDGSKYIGTHSNGLPHGSGTIYYSNGDKYVGGWAKHAPHGKGIMYYKDGRSLNAEWTHGKPTQVLSSDEGIVDEHIEVDNDKKVKVWAVIAGVSRYQHLQSLKYTDDDAYRIYAFLKSPEGGALPDEQISVLIDEDANKSNILRTLKRVFLKADENDVVMFYFSGHGLEGSFVPSDYDGMNNLVKHTEVKEILNNSKAKHKIIFADACHSGSMLAMRSTSSIQSTIDKYYSAFSDINGGTALMMSSKAEETSLEDEGLRQGVFSHFLLKGLKGQADFNSDKVVTITELFQFVYNSVSDYTVNAQTPTLKGSYDENMPISIVR